MAIRIKILPEELVNKIAAGEVVERPASVVKELVENALDAGADDVSVDIRGGGRSHIQVIDNGCGMSRDDALLAFERHATSKIASTDDLFAIRTLGFRGEALAAIAGVSRVELVTRQAESPAAVRMHLLGGLVKSVEEAGAPVGTSILVKDLFFNTPARLKFMKSVAVETGHIIDLMTRLALSHEDVGMKLTRGPETLLQVSPVTRGADRLVEALGPDLVSHLYPFQAERAGVRVHGYLSAPELSRSGWSGLYAFVNRRFMRDRVLTHAVAEAYRGVIPKGRYPIAAVFIEIEPTEVDVNVHPGKIEVRFARPRTVADLVIEAMRGTLVRAPWRKSPAPPVARPALPQRALFPEPGLETPVQAEAADLLMGDILAEREADMQRQQERARALQASRPRPVSLPPEEEEERARLESLEALAQLAVPVREERFGFASGAEGRHAGGAGPLASSLDPAQRHASMPAGRPSGPALDHPGASLDAPSNPLDLPSNRLDAPSNRLDAPSNPLDIPSNPLDIPSNRLDAPSNPLDIPSNPLDIPSNPLDLPSNRLDLPSNRLDIPSNRLDAPSNPLDASSSLRHVPAAPYSPSPSPGPYPPPRWRDRSQPGILPGFEDRNFSRMRIIGQYANCFLLCQDGDDLVIIDQHAAHERVTFEQLKQAYEGIGARNQLLLTPRIVELPRREAELLTDHLETLEALGLEVEPFGGQTFAVKSMPVPLLDEEPASLLTDVANDLAGDVARQPLHERIYLLLATMACHGSIRANRKMSLPEMEALLRLLDGTDFSFACPHGRPLISRAGRRDIEKLFKRT